MALYRAYAIPEAGKAGAAGEKSRLSSKPCLATNLNDNDTLSIEDDGSREGMAASRGMTEIIKKFIVSDNIKALMPIGEAWKRATE